MNKILCYFGFHKWSSHSKNIPTDTIKPSDYIEDKFEAYKYEMNYGDDHRHYTYICKVCSKKEKWVEQRGGLIGYELTRLKKQ